MSVAQKYLELLSTEGYRPDLEGDEGSPRIVFKAEGASFRMILDEEDPEFFGLTLGYGVPEGHEFGRLTGLANELNDRWKVVKATIHPDGDAVRFAFEIFTGDAVSPGLLERAIRALRLVAEEFFEELRKAEPEAKA